MSRYNRLRLINFNYNDNGKYKILDETFVINCLNTIFELSNGGGKTTIVRAICESLFYKDRRTSKNNTHFPQDVLHLSKTPTFIMAEFKLEGSGGYVTFGTMYCRAKNNEAGYEMLRFASEYNDPNDPLSIKNLCFTKKEGNQYIFKSREECETLFNKWKKEGRFLTYSPINTTQNNKYFETLRECGIMFEDYQYIMKKVNMQEDDLSNVFKSEKTSGELVNRWILPRIENYFSASPGRMNLESLKKSIEESIRNAAESEEWLKKEREYKKNLDILNEILKTMPDYVDFYDKSNQYRKELQEFHERLYNTWRKHKNDLAEKDKAINKKQRDKIDLDIEKLSLKYYKANTKLIQYKQEKEPLTKDQQKIKNSLDDLKYTRTLNSIKPFYNDLQDCINERDKAKDQLEISSKNDNAINIEKNYIGAYLKKIWNNQIEKDQENLNQCNKRSQTIKEKIEELKKEINQNIDKKVSISEEKARREERCKQYKEKIVSYNTKWSANLSNNLMGDYQPSINQESKAISENISFKEEQKQNTLETLSNKKEALSDSERRINQLSNELDHLNQDLPAAKEKYKAYLKEETKRLNIITYLKLNQDYLYKTEEILKQINFSINRKNGEIEDYYAKVRECEKRINYFESGNISIPEDFKAICEKYDVSFMSGQEYLKRFDKDEQNNLINAYPVLPYSIVLTNYAEGILNRTLPHTKRPVICIDRKQLVPKDSSNHPSLIPMQDGYVYANFDVHWLDDAYIREQIETNEKDKKEYNEQIKRCDQERDILYERKNIIKNQDVSSDLKEQLNDQIKTLEKDIEIKREDKNREEVHSKKLKSEIDSLEQKQQTKEKEIADLKERFKNLKGLEDSHPEYHSAYQELDRNEQSIKVLENNQKKINDDIESYEVEKDKVKDKRNYIEREIEKICKNVNKVKNCKDQDKPEEFNDEILCNETRAFTRYQELSKKESKERQKLEEALNELEERVRKKRDQFRKQCNQEHVEEASVPQTKELSNEELEQLNAQIEELENRLKQNIVNISDLDYKIRNEKYYQDNSLHDLSNKYKRNTPLPREQVRESINFDEEENILEKEIEKLKREKNQLDKIIESLGSFKEKVFEFLTKNGIETSRNLSVSYFENDSSDFIRKQYNNLKNEYIHNFNNMNKTIEAINPSIQALDQRLKSYNLEKLTSKSNAHACTKLYTNIYDNVNNVYQTYKKTSEKVEDSKNQNLEQLIGYIRNVYQELDRFGKNVSVTFKDGTKARIFHIKSPKWNNSFNETCKGYARIYLDELYEEGIKRINGKSVNLEETFENLMAEQEIEYIFPKIVKSVLKVRVLKFEADEHVMKDWETIMLKNSGAERIVSSFIVLCCLMQYQHQNPLSNTSRLKSDSKVLILDNPFGRLTSDHLLEPFIQCAEATNTQILCFTDISQPNVPLKFPNIINLMLYQNHLKIENQIINQQEDFMAMEHQQISIIDRIN